MSLRKQSILYVVVGVAQFLLDWAVMVYLSTHGMNVEWANIAGRVAGACLGFTLNGLWTFKSEHTKIGRKQLGKFVVMWLVCTALSTLGVYYIDHFYGLKQAQLFKPAVEGLVGIVGFLLSRHWVYHK